MKDAFKEFDTDGSGSIDRVEMLHMIPKICERSATRMCTPPPCRRITGHRDQIHLMRSMGGPRLYRPCSSLALPVH
eukprot:931220-Prymnesium_polylepis.2